MKLPDVEESADGNSFQHSGSAMHADIRGPINEGDCGPRSARSGRTPRILDRHEYFASTVRPAVERAASNQRALEDWPASGRSGVSSRLFLNSAPTTLTSRSDTPRKPIICTPPGSAPTAWRPQARKAAGLRSQNSTSMFSGRTGFSGGSGSGASHGVPIKISNLARHETIANRITGRPGESPAVRIYVRLPGGDRFALWVPPDLRVGPVTPLPTIPGLTEDPEKSSGRMTPVRALLTQQMRNGGDFDGASSPESMHRSENKGWFTNLTRTESTDSLLLQDVSLKGLIEAATGIPAIRQQLVLGGRGPLQDASRPLHQYDVGHGATLLLTIKQTGDRQEVQFLASPALKKEFDTHHSDFIFERMAEFMNSKASLGGREAKDLVEPLPDFDFAHLRPHHAKWAHSEIMFQDYSFLADNNIFDLTGRIRKRMYKM